MNEVPRVIVVLFLMAVVALWIEQRFREKGTCLIRHKIKICLRQFFVSIEGTGVYLGVHR